MNLPSIINKLSKAITQLDTYAKRCETKMGDKIRQITTLNGQHDTLRTDANRAEKIASNLRKLLEEE